MKLLKLLHLKGTGGKEVSEIAISLAKEHKKTELLHVFEGSAEHAIAHIEESIEQYVDSTYLRFFAIKLFERDEKAIEFLKLPKDILEHIEEHIVECENELDDDAESIIINQRYAYISKKVSMCVTKKHREGGSVSDKIDSIVTNRILALPIFVAIIFLLYYISVTTVGTWATDWTNNVLVGEWVMGNLSSWFESMNVAPWLSGLVVDGIVGGVGAVIGFVPQILLVSFLLAILEDVWIYGKSCVYNGQNFQ